MKVILSTTLLLETGLFKSEFMTKEEALKWVNRNNPDNFSGHETVKILGLVPNKERKNCLSYTEALCLTPKERLDFGKEYSLEEIENIGVTFTLITKTPNVETKTKVIEGIITMNHLERTRNNLNEAIIKSQTSLNSFNTSGSKYKKLTKDMDSLVSSLGTIDKIITENMVIIDRFPNAVISLNSYLSPHEISRINLEINHSEQIMSENKG